MGEELRRVPIGVTDFKEIREEDYYFVDKSEIISDIVSSGAKFLLFTRPRRFGKSLNLSMMDRFFNLEFKGNTWFDGLKVMEHPRAVGMMNRYPVVRISISGIRTDSLRLFESDFKGVLSRVFVQFEYLKKSDRISEFDREQYIDIKPPAFDETQAQDYLSALCRMLEAHHGVKPVVLIDEYDNVINNAYGKDSYDEILSFMKVFYQNTLKENEHLSFAVMTGIMQIARESIFSGLNSFEVDNIFSTESDERYGFTADEVKDLCAYYGHPERYEKAREWYDGYRFGDADVYNPWSVLRYIKSKPGSEPQAYWAGTSGNDIIDTLVSDADDETYGDLLALGEGRVLEGKDIRPTITMEDLGMKKDAIYSVMVMSGYLNAVRPNDGVYRLSIPNREMYEVFTDVIAVDGVGTSPQLFRGFFDAAEKGDVERMEAFAFDIFAEHFQDWDLPDEGAYRRILAGAAMSRCGRYTVTTEAQSGNGRSDLVMRRNIPSVPNIVMEFKKTGSEDPAVHLKEAEEGLRQIRRREYFHSLKGRTLLYGVCMFNKKAKVVEEELDLRAADLPPCSIVRGVAWRRRAPERCRVHPSSLRNPSVRRGSVRTAIACTGR